MAPLPPPDAPTDTTPHCPTCAYDLTGLHLPAPCPECGRTATDETVHRVRAWPSRSFVCRSLLWPAMLAPLLIPIWLIEKPIGIVASALLLCVAMFVPVSIAGSISVDCCVPSRREAAFLKMLALGWTVNLTAWIAGALLGYALGG